MNTSETIAIGMGVGAHVTESKALVDRVNAALDEVRPSIHRDGGDVWLIRIDGRVALVQMVGACGGCAMAMSTLKGAIEATVTARCPEIERVEQI